jgi:glycosyltransferase EpsE
MPTISVLMGAYNCSDTIGKSIESIQKQTVTDWEMIICDDGSTDRTVEVVQEYAKNDDRIVLIANKENKGLSYTLNHCLQYAKGTFCARMDGDDLCDETRFEKQLRFLTEHPEYDIVSTTMKRFDEAGEYNVPEIGETYEVTKKDFVKGSPFCHAPAMLKTEAYRKVGGYRDLDTTRGVEDYDSWFRMYAQGMKGCVICEPLYSMFDGRGAAVRRSFQRRKNEAWVRKEGYKMLKTPLLYRVYVLKPIVLGMVPQGLYKRIRKLK